jgi:hypothetical protein
MPSSVFPMAIAIDVASDPNVVAPARNAPLAMAGQTRFPHSRQNASANPLGGQTGLAFGCTEASARPILANRKYASPRAPKESAPTVPWVHFDVSAKLRLPLAGRVGDASQCLAVLTAREDSGILRSRARRRSAPQHHRAVKLQLHQCVPGVAPGQKTARRAATEPNAVQKGPSSAALSRARDKMPVW